MIEYFKREDTYIKGHRIDNDWVKGVSIKCIVRVGWVYWEIEDGKFPVTKSWRQITRSEFDQALVEIMPDLVNAQQYLLEHLDKV